MNKASTAFRMSLVTKVWVGAFLIVYFWVIWHFSVNIPYADDYGSLMLGTPVLVRLAHAHQYKQFFLYLFTQFYEERLVTMRLLGFLQYEIFGRLNLKILMWIANLYKVGLCYLFYVTAKNKSNKLILMLLLLIFQLTDWDSAFWSMCGLEAYSVIFFALLSLWLLQHSLLKPLSFKVIALFLGACLCSFLATFSNGNGMMVFVPGVLMLLLYKDVPKLLLYVLVAVSSILFFFHGYVFEEFPLAPYWQLKIFYFAVDFLGSMGRNNIAFVLGIFGICVLVWLVRQDKHVTKNLFFYWLLFIFMTLLVIARTRMMQDGDHVYSAALQSRYTLYSVCFFSILLVWYVNLGKKIHAWLCVLMSVLFFINFVHGIKDASERSNALEHYQLQPNGIIMGLAAQEGTGVATHILQMAADRGIYYLPPYREMILCKR